MKLDRLLAIGDIHGCLLSLQALMEQVKPTQDDKVIFLGDFCDRGPDTFGVIEYLIEFKMQFPRTVFLMGNHEDMFMKYLDIDCNQQEMYMFLANGGRQTLESYEQSLDLDKFYEEDLPESHFDFLDGLKYLHEEGKYVFVHGGVRSGFPISEQLPHDVMWLRDEFLYSERADKWEDRVIVHGHTPMDADEQGAYHRAYPNKRNLDSGCVFRYHLSCEDVLTQKRWCQPCLDMGPQRVKIYN